MAGCGWRHGLSLADAGLIAATLDNVTSPSAWSNCCGTQLSDHTDAVTTMASPS
jgi:hypothetical protein